MSRRLLSNKNQELHILETWSISKIVIKWCKNALVRVSPLTILYRQYVSINCQTWWARLPHNTLSSKIHCNIILQSHSSLGILENTLEIIYPPLSDVSRYISYPFWKTIAKRFILLTSSLLQILLYLFNQTFSRRSRYFSTDISYTHQFQHTVQILYVRHMFQTWRMYFYMQRFLLWQ